MTEENSVNAPVAKLKPKPKNLADSKALAQKQAEDVRDGLFRRAAELEDEMIRKLFMDTEVFRRGRQFKESYPGGVEEADITHFATDLIDSMRVRLKGDMYEIVLNKDVTFSDGRIVRGGSVLANVSANSLNAVWSIVSKEDLDKVNTELGASEVAKAYSFGIIANQILRLNPDGHKPLLDKNLLSVNYIKPMNVGEFYNNIHAFPSILVVAKDYFKNVAVYDQAHDSEINVTNVPPKGIAR